MNVQQKKVSIEDVAARAGVSITTVSRVINNVSTVTEKNRRQVEEAVKFLKFKPNVSAQRLARGFNNSIGLVMPGYPGIFHSFYAVELIRGVGHGCEVQKLDMVFHISNATNSLNTNNVGGLIFADIIDNHRQVESVLALGIPCLVVNHKVTDLDVNYIAVNNVLGAEMAADYLVSLGHKRIATVTGNLHTQGGTDRLKGFQKLLEKKKIVLPGDYVFEGDYSRRSARAAAEKFFSLANPPTAIFAASDEMALELMSYILEKGMKVPDDVSLIGFDDNPACLYAPTALTTIKQPLFKMGEDAVKILGGIMTGKITGKKKIVLDPELVLRESCASPHK